MSVCYVGCDSEYEDSRREGSAENTRNKYVCIHKHTFIHTCIIHTYMHTYTHIYIHTYIQMSPLNCSHASLASVCQQYTRVPTRVAL